MQSHLDEPRTSYRMLDLSEIPLGRACKGARGRDTGIESSVGIGDDSPIGRGVLEVRGKNNLILRYVKARVIEQVEELCVILQPESLAQLELFENAKIKSVLERTAEDVALVVRRVPGLEVIADRRARWLCLTWRD